MHSRGKTYMRDRTNAVKILLLAAAASLSFVLTPTFALAQHVPLAEMLPRLILGDVILDSPPIAANPQLGIAEGFSHMAHFSPIQSNEPNNPVVGIVQGFNGQMATQFSTFPLGSSTGGLT